MISLAGKAALITGGSRGIGAAAVKLFAQAGADVVFNYHRSKDAALQVEQEQGTVPNGSTGYHKVPVTIAAGPTASAPSPAAPVKR